MEDANDPDLERLFKPTEPLGPHDQINIEDDAVSTVLYSRVAPFGKRSPQAQQTTLSPKTRLVLVGRRGSGKTAILADRKQRLLPARSYLVASPADFAQKNNDFVLSIGSWRHFHDLVTLVQRRAPPDVMAQDIVIPEYVTSLWIDQLWEEIAKYFYEFAMDGLSDGLLQPVVDFVNGKFLPGFSDIEGAAILFKNAQSSILTFLEKTNSRFHFLFDSMDKYPIRNHVFRQVVDGMFQALAKLNSASSRIVVCFCLPEELEKYLKASSSAIMKSFGSKYRLRWRPIDLLRVVAHRYRLLQKIHDRAFYDEISDFDFNSRHHVHSLFARILPASVENTLGIEEDPLAYITRHTQLLPRHFIVYFNSMLNRTFERTGGYREISEETVREIVNEEQHTVAEDVLNPFRMYCPALIDACHKVLPNLAPIVRLSDLHEIQRQFNQRIEEDIVDVWAMLFEIGILGQVVRQTDAGVLPKNPERYCYANFHYNYESARFGLANSELYCFHPVFTGHFGIPRPEGERRLVYPANIEMIFRAGNAE